MARICAMRGPFKGVAFLILSLLGVFLDGCFRSPDLSKITCKDNSSCPGGYMCELPGKPGGCRKPAGGGGTEAATARDAIPSLDAVVSIDASASIDLGIPVDTGGERIVTAIDQILDMGEIADGGIAPDVPLSGPQVDVGIGGTDGRIGGGTGGAGGGSGGSGGSTTPVEGSDGATVGPDVAIGGTGGGSGGNTGTGGNTAGTGGASGGTTGSGGNTAGTGGGSGGSAGAGGTTVSTGGNDAGPDTPGTGGAPGRPPGYWMSSDWGLTGVNWSGCVWTQVDSVSGSTSTILPQDFTSNHQPSDPYHVSGSVFNDYNAVAVVAFNLNEPITGASNQCVHRTLDSGTVLPPGVTFPTNAGGISIDWKAATAPAVFRIELRGQTGFSDPTQRWCANITDMIGPTFVPFRSLNTKCWTLAGQPSGNPYNGEPISSIAFYVAGTVVQKTSFDFTINSFSIGYTIGGSATLDSANQRVKVLGSDGRQYIVQNNNSGNPTGSTQTIYYANNSFKVLNSTGTGSVTPASFPSIYVGANGYVGASGSTYVTTDDNLPMQVGAISSALSSFAWSGGTGGKDFNAAFDLWFAKTAPVAGSYNDAISGEIMIWLYKPNSHQPSGSVTRTTTIAGQLWNVWIGPHVTTGPGTDGANRPVLSYIAQSFPVSTLSPSFKDFISDAVANGAADMTAGGTSRPLRTHGT
jgi:hypothetical protein